MESAEFINKKAIFSSITTKINKDILNVYLDAVFQEISSKDGKKAKFMDFSTFSAFLSFPFFISENLFNLSKKRKEEEHISSNIFKEIFNQILIYNVGENEIVKKLDFMLSFFLKLSNMNDQIFTNDFSLIFYHFHMQTNRVKKNISAIDNIITDFSTIDNAKKESFSSSEFLKRIKEKSDIFYLFYFFLNYYKPFDENEIEFITSEIQCTNIEVSPISTKIKGNESLSAPSSILFNYLNREFNLNLVYYTEADCELKELDDFMMDIVNTKLNKTIFHKYAFIDTDLILSPNNLTFRTTKRIVPLHHSYLLLSNEKNSINIHTCNEKNSLTITFDGKNSKKIFIEKYKKFLNVTQIQDKYDLLEQISTGEYGTIFVCKLKAQKTPNKLYIAKMLIKNQNPNYRWELSINKFISKANLEGAAKCYDTYETIDKIYIVNEFIESGSLSDFLFNSVELLSSEIISKILMNILKVLKNLNKFGIIHRDIKPDNILLTQNLEAKFIDFGFSRVIATNQHCSENCGTVCYASPELITKQQYTKKTDFWSIGVIAYYLQFGELPFDDTEDDCIKISEKIVSLQYELPNSQDIENYCPLAYDLINNFFKFENERPELSNFV